MSLWSAGGLDQGEGADPLLRGLWEGSDGSAATAESAQSLRRRDERASRSPAADHQTGRRAGRQQPLRSRQDQRTHPGHPGTAEVLFWRSWTGFCQGDSGLFVQNSTLIQKKTLFKNVSRNFTAV